MLKRPLTSPSTPPKRLSDFEGPDMQLSTPPSTSSTRYDALPSHVTDGDSGATYELSDNTLGSAQKRKRDFDDYSSPGYKVSYNIQTPSSIAGIGVSPAPVKIRQHDDNPFVVSDNCTPSNSSIFATPPSSNPLETPSGAMSAEVISERLTSLRNDASAYISKLERREKGAQQRCQKLILLLDMEKSKNTALVSRNQELEQEIAL